MSDHSSMEDTRECISAMLEQEEKFYACPDYMSVDFSQIGKKPLHSVVDECMMLVTDLKLSGDEFPHRKSLSSVATDSFVSLSSRHTSTKKSDLDHSNMRPWRRQMILWAYTSIDVLGYNREIVAVAFSIVDRYLAKKARYHVPISRVDYQLFCMTSIYIAVKMLEPLRKLSIESVIDMSRGYYTKEDVVATELDILQSLKWHVNPPTVVSFLRAYLVLVPDSDSLLGPCLHIVESALADSYFVSQKASSLAKAAILMAADEQDFDLTKLRQLQKVADLLTEDVTETYRHLERCFE